MRGLTVRRCQVDEAYSFSYSEDPAIGTLTPTLCSHAPTHVVRLQAKPADPAVAPRPPRDFTLCSTHRAIVDAFDRSIVNFGGKPRVLGVRALPPA